MNTHWMFQSSSLEGLKLGTDERRYFALHPNTGKTLVPKHTKDFKDFISNKMMEIKNDRR